jgi:hypothetical protein
MLLPVPSTKCCGELSWNLNARKYGYPYWKRKTRVNVVLCSCLSLVPNINFLGLILLYREFTCQTNSPLICAESSNECESVEVPGQQNPLDSTASLTFGPSKMRPPRCVAKSGTNHAVKRHHISGARRPNRTATKA